MTAQGAPQSAPTALCLSHIPDPPDAVPAVIRHEQRTIRRDGNACRASPLAVRTWINNKPCEEVFDRSRLAILKGNKDDLCAVRRRPIPRSVQRDEQPVPEALRKLHACIERNADRRRVSGYQHVRYDRTLYKVRFALRDARVDVGSDVRIGPTVKTALLDRRRIFGRRIIA